MARTYEQAKEVIETFEKKLKLAGAMQINWIEEQTFRKDSILNWLVDFFYFNCNYINDYGKRCIENTTKVGLRYDQNNKDCSYPGARRSLGDLYRLALTHFSKDLKLIDVVEALTEIVEKQILIQRPDIPSKYKYKIYCTNCGSVHRRVFTISTLDGHNSYKISTNNGENNAGSDEDNITKEDYLVVWKEHSKRRREEEDRLKEEEVNRKRKEIKNTLLSSLDDEVAKKIQEILLANSEKSSLVKPSKKKLKKVA